MKPTVSLKGKNPQKAIFGHILALIAAAIAILWGLLTIFQGSFLGKLFGILLAIFVIVIELDLLILPTLKDSLTRGIIWILLAVLGAGSGNLTAIAIAISGILYIIYHYE